MGHSSPLIRSLFVSEPAFGLALILCGLAVPWLGAAAGDAPRVSSHAQFQAFEADSVASSTALAVSGDGAVVVGYAEFGGSTRAWRWRDGQIQWLEDPGGRHAVAAAVSHDGSVAAGHVFIHGIQRAAIWKQDGLTVGEAGYALHLSPDGTMVAGAGPSGGWMAQDGQPRQNLPFQPSGFVTGKVLLESGQAFDPEPGISRQLWPPPGPWHRFSGDGTMGVFHADSLLGHGAFALHKQQLIDLGSLSHRHEVVTRIMALSRNGAVAAGSGDAAEGKPTALVWTANTGLRGVQERLLNAGVVLPGWWLEAATGLSDDGRTMAGWGRDPEGRRRAWQAQLARPALADCDADGALSAGPVQPAGAPVAVRHLPDGSLIVLDALHGRLRRFDSGGEPREDLARSQDWVGALDMALDESHAAVLTALGLDLVDIDGTRNATRISLEPAAKPAGVAASDSGWLVSLAARNRVVRFDAPPTSTVVIDADLRAPGAVAVNAQGQIAVADQHGRRVQQFDASGRLLRRLAGGGSGPGQVSGTADLLWHANDLYLADTGNHRIQQFQAEGGLRAAWGYPHQLPGLYQVSLANQSWPQSSSSPSGDAWNVGSGRLRFPSSLSVGEHWTVVCSQRSGDCRWFRQVGKDGHTVACPGPAVSRWQFAGPEDWRRLAAPGPAYVIALRGPARMERLSRQDGHLSRIELGGYQGNMAGALQRVEDVLLTEDGQRLYVLDHRRLSLWQLSADAFRMTRALDLARTDIGPATALAWFDGGLALLAGAGQSLWRTAPDLTAITPLRWRGTALAIAGRNDRLHVLDATDRSLVTLSRDGTEVRREAVASSAWPAWPDPSIAVLPEGTVAMADWRRGQILRLPAGEALPLPTLDQPRYISASGNRWLISEWGALRYWLMNEDNLPESVLGGTLSARLVP